ncbi:glycoside hydrolase superfamily [Aspergillus californicus]
MHTPNTETLLSKLTLEEKVSLLAAVDWWRTPVINRDDVFVPHIKTTDGPNGARGESYVSGIKAACFPCGTSLGASFDRDLLYRVGQEIAKEARTKAAHVLLAPTLNVIRSPRGGRNYETYSEDPLVLGALAAAFINGCQSMGIAATPKHFVANETENNRTRLSAEVDEQTLREIYLLPFQLLMKWSDPWCLMTSYNKVNGTYVSDSTRLVTGVVRQEWGFKGVVVSDWMGVYSTAASVNAGVDIDLPGPTKWRGDKLLDAIAEGDVSEETITASARRILDLAKRLGRFEHPEEPPEIALQSPSRDLFIRTAAAESMVLLKNDGDVLPLSRKSTVAVIGHHAFTPTLGGGGSARVDALHVVSPVEGLKEAGFNVLESPGVPVFGALPHADSALLYESSTRTQSPTPVKIEWFNGSASDPVYTETKALPEYMIKEKWPSYLTAEYCTRMTFDIRPTTTGTHIFSIISTGPATCLINNKEVYTRPQETDLKPESFYFFKSQLERRFTYPMRAGEFYTITLTSWNTDPALLNAPPISGRMFQGSALRFHEEINIPTRLHDARTAAASADAAVICIGTTQEIESEGFDRATISLSQDQYAQILAIASSQPRTIVVNFSGAPVDLTPIVDDVPALLQAWFPGQEAGHSLALVLGGDVNPSGRLPFSWPRQDEDNPSHGNFPCDEGLVVRYEEGLDVGYRFYERDGAPTPLFPFGFGLSFGVGFAVSGLSLDSALEGVDGSVTATCRVRNRGSRSGAVAVQYYISYPSAGTAGNTKRPIKELKEFQKVRLGAGSEKEVAVELDKYAVSFYNAEEACWQADAGRYTLSVGLSVVDIHVSGSFEVREMFTWNGL